MDYSCGFGPGFGGSLRRGGNIRKSLSVSSKYIGGADYVLRTQLAEQLKCMDSKWEMDNLYLNDIVEFYRKRAMLEQEYSDALNKLVTTAKQKLNTESTKRQNWPKYSYHSLITVLFESTAQTAVAHQVAAEVFSKQMTQRLQDLLDDSTRAHKQSRELAQLCQATVLSTTAKLNATYRDYCNSYQMSEDAKRTMEKSKEKFDRERKRAHDKNKDLDKSQKIKKLKEDLNQKCDFNAKNNVQTLQSRNEHLVQIAAANASVEKYFGQEIFDLLNCLNLGFHNSIVRAGLNHISCEKSLANTHRSTAQMIEKLVQTIDPNRDQLKFLNSNQSAFNKTCAFNFQTIKDDVITCVMSHPSLLELFHSAINTLQENMVESKQKFEEYWSMSNESTKKLHKLIDLRDYDVEDLFTKSIISHSKNGSRSNLDTINNRMNESQSYLHLRSTTRNNRIELEKQYFEQFSAFIVENHHYHVLTAKIDCLKQALTEGNQIIPAAVNSRHSVRMDTNKMVSGGSSSGSSSSSCCDKSMDKNNASGVRIFGGTLDEYVKITQQQIPPLISSAIDVISKYGIQVQGIFRISGSQADINELKDMYDNLQDPLYIYTCNTSGQAGATSIPDVNVAACLLKMYFRELSEPIISGRLFHRIVELYETERERDSFIEKVADVLLDLSPDTYIVLRYLFGFLRNLTVHKDENMMDSYNLAICLGPCLMPIPVELNKVLFHMQAIVNEIIRLLIENHSLVFSSQQPNHHGPLYEPPLVTTTTTNQNSCLQNSIPGTVSSGNNNNGPGPIFYNNNSNNNNLGHEYDEAHSTLTSHRTNRSIDGSDTLEGSGASDSSSNQDDMKQLDSPPYLAIAISDFCGQTESELSFRKDDQLILDDFISDHWWQGRPIKFHLNNSPSNEMIEGLIPLAYVHIVGQFDENNYQNNNNSNNNVLRSHHRTRSINSIGGERDNNNNNSDDITNQDGSGGGGGGARSTTPIAILQVNHHDDTQESHYLHIGPVTMTSPNNNNVPPTSNMTSSVIVTMATGNNYPQQNPATISNPTANTTTNTIISSSNVTSKSSSNIRSKSPSPDIQPPNAFSDRQRQMNNSIFNTAGILSSMNTPRHHNLPATTFSPNIEHHPFLETGGTPALTAHPFPPVPPSSLPQQSALSTSLQMLSSFGFSPSQPGASAGTAAPSSAMTATPPSVMMHNNQRRINASNTTTTTDKPPDESYSSSSNTTTTKAPKSKPVLTHTFSETSANSETDIDAELANVLQGLASIESKTTIHNPSTQKQLETQLLLQQQEYDELLQGMTSGHTARPAQRADTRSSSSSCSEKESPEINKKRGEEDDEEEAPNNNSSTIKRKPSAAGSLEASNKEGQDEEINSS